MGIAQKRWMVFLVGNPIVRNGWATPMTQETPIWMPWGTTRVQWWGFQQQQQEPEQEEPSGVSTCCSSNLGCQLVVLLVMENPGKQSWVIQKARIYIARERSTSPALQKMGSNEEKWMIQTGQRGFGQKRIAIQRANIWIHPIRYKKRTLSGKSTLELHGEHGGWNHFH